jgi:hypothetical protein
MSIVRFSVLKPFLRDWCRTFASQNQSVKYTFALFLLRPTFSGKKQPSEPAPHRISAFVSKARVALASVPCSATSLQQVWRFSAVRNWRRKRNLSGQEEKSLHTCRGGRPGGNALFIAKCTCYCCHASETVQFSHHGAGGRSQKPLASGECAVTHNEPSVSAVLRKSSQTSRQWLILPP